jgi:hypothetical protein
MPFRFIAFTLLLFYSLASYSQQEEVPFYSETGVGLNFNTNGGIIGGVFFKRSTHIKGNMYHYFSSELINVKHPKEDRDISRVTGNTYIRNKANYLFSLRGNYGREFLLFRKSEEEGVRVSGILAGGLTLGIVKPYAIDYDYTDYGKNPGSPPVDVRAEPYDPEKHIEPNRILGTGGLFTAFGKSKIMPGLNLKGALAFEFGNSTTGLEVGGLVELFPKTIVLLANGHNASAFSSIYINIYYASRN